MASEELSIIVRMRDFATAQASKLKGVIGGITKQIFSLKGLLAGVGLAFTGKQIADLIIGTAAWGDRIQKLSLRLGVTTEALSELAFAAERSGTSIEDLETGFRTATRNLQEFANFGVGEARDALQLLGPDVVRLVEQGTRLEDLLPRLSQEFKRLGESDRVFVASKLFGRSGTALIPLLTDDIDKLRKRARELGLTLSQETANDAAAFTDALTDLESSLQGLKQAIVGTLLPEFTTGLKGLTDLLVENRPAVIGAAADLVESFTAVSVSAGRSLLSINALVGGLENLKGRAGVGQLGILGGFFKLMEAAEGRGEGGFGDALLDAAYKADKAIGSSEATAKKLAALLDAAERAGKRAAEALRQRAKDEAGVVGDLRSSFEEADRAMEDLLGTARDTIPVTERKIKADRQALDISEGMQESFDRLNDELERRAELEQRELERDDFTSGLSAEFKRMGEEAREYGSMAARMARGVEDALVSNMVDPLMELVNGTKTAKEAFHDMAIGIINDCARIAMEEVFRGLIKQAFGTLGAALGGFQGGGIAEQTGPYVLHGPEAVVPLPNNRHIPVEIRGGGGGLGAAVNVTVHYHGIMTSDAERRFFRRHAEDIAEVIVTKQNTSARFRQRMAS